MTFARNSLVRDMTFRSNFIIETISSTAWLMMNLGFYVLIFMYADHIAGWEKFQFFVFIATTMLVNSLVQAFFMPNVQEFSELIRTGGLDFALLKPIDTQFLISFQRVTWSSLGNFGVGVLLLVYSLFQLGWTPAWYHYVLYPLYILLGVAILYSLMIAMAATSIWMGRNQSLYNFWFYVTIFSRYPMEIYRGPYGQPLRLFFTYAIPILVVVNVPARMLAQPLAAGHWPLAMFAIVATASSLLASRWVFHQALLSYRSASS